jgi:hypothetical protein
MRSEAAKSSVENSCDMLCPPQSPLDWAATRRDPSRCVNPASDCLRCVVQNGYSGANLAHKRAGVQDQFVNLLRTTGRTKINGGALPLAAGAVARAYTSHSRIH